MSDQFAGPESLAVLWSGPVWFLVLHPRGRFPGSLGEQARAAGVPGYPPYNPALKGEKATLAFWLLPELASHPAYRQAIALFQRQYPGVSVSVTPIAKDDILTKLKIALAGDGAIPDLVSHHGYVLGAQSSAYKSDGAALVCLGSGINIPHLGVA